MTDAPRVIVALDAANVKRLKTVSIRPDGAPVVTIAGRNAQGKSSVLDAVWLALAGAPAAKAMRRPVRDGEDTAYVRLDLGDLIVERRWTDGGARSALTVTSKDGARFASPQTLLDSLVGRLSMDPLAFAGLDAKAQRAALLELVELPFDLDAEQRRRATWFAERTDLTRSAKRLAAQALGLEAPNAPEPVDVDALLAQARDTQLARREAERVNADRRTYALRLATARRHVDELEEQLVTARREQGSAQHAYDELPPEVTVIPDETALLDAVSAAQETNRQAAVAAEQRRALDDVNARQAADAAAAEERTQWIAALDELVRAGLEEAAMPVDGLGFDDDGITYRGVPFAQASSAEQLRVSCAIAMSSSPSVRVMRVQNGSLLDSAHLAILEGMAVEHGWQVWLERVDESGAVGVVIEDGEVRA